MQGTPPTTSRRSPLAGLWDISFSLASLASSRLCLYESGTATAYLIYSFHTPKGAVLANLQKNSISREILNCRSSSPGCLSQIELQVTNSSDNLVFHWGGILDNNGKWVLPSRHPDGTKVYKNRALRTPFIKSGSNSFLRLEIDDPAIQAIEFLIFDIAQNKWFKHKGDNFHIKLPS